MWKPFFIPFNSVSCSKVQYGATAAPCWGISSFPTLRLILQTNPAQGKSTAVGRADRAQPGSPEPSDGRDMQKKQDPAWAGEQ